MRHNISVLSILVLILLLSCSCSVRREKQTQLCKLKEIVESSVSKKGSNVPLAFKEKLGIYEFGGLSIIFIVDSGCSACLNDLLTFLDLSEDVTDIKDVYAVINENHEEILKYYLGLFFKQKQVGPCKLITVEDYFPYGYAGSNNVILLRDNNVVSVFSFHDGRITVD